MKSARKISEADVAEKVSGCLETYGDFQLVDWNDLGEVTVQIGGQTFRATFHNITNEDD